MVTNGEKCFGQEALKWDKCPALEPGSDRVRLGGRLVCDQCFNCAALEDRLTGLPNRLSIMEAFEDFKIKHGEFGALLVDLTNFKHVNDTFGHQQGDEMLRQTAQFFAESTREDDYFIGRIGGDEFAVLLRLKSRQATGLEPDEMLVSAGNSLAARYAEYGPIAEYNANPNVSEDKKLGIRFGHALWDHSMRFEDLLMAADVKGLSKSEM